jgi:hypothetical protein
VWPGNLIIWYLQIKESEREYQEKHELQNQQGYAKYHHYPQRAGQIEEKDLDNYEQADEDWHLEDGGS